MNGERTLRILHISDLHARGKRKVRLAWKRNKMLLEPWLRNLGDLAADGRAFDLVVFTGDVADWGQADEYEEATRFIEEILVRLVVPRERFFVVPGNHDIDRKVEQEAWAHLREGIWSGPGAVSEWMAGEGRKPFGFDDAWRDAVLAREHAFWRWVEQDLGRGALLPLRSPHRRLGYRVTLDEFGPPVHIIGLDSAWLAGDDTDAGKLWLTDDQVGMLGHDENGNQLDGFRLALVHHPLTDLADADSATRLLGGTVDLLLRGHQHSPVVHGQEVFGQGLRELAAGTLYETAADSHIPNSFQVLDAVLDAGGRPLRYEIRFRAWSKVREWWHDDSRLAPNGRFTWPVERGSSPAILVDATDSGAVPRVVVDSEDTEPIELDTFL